MPATPEKTALLTGGSSGIGEAIAKRLVEDGWQVLALSRSEPKFKHHRLKFCAVDLLDDTAFQTLLNRVGPVDAIIHSAGVLRAGSISEMKLEDADLMWRLHMDCAARLVQTLSPRMPNGGRIVLIGSRVANGVAGRSLYAASKSALIGFSRSIAAELAARQITANIIAPGATDTPMLHDPARASTPPIMPPMRRLVRPEEVAATAAFLLSDGAASITGQNIVICGGSSL